LKALETRRSEVKNLYDARMEDVENEESKRRVKANEKIDTKYRKMQNILINRMGKLQSKKDALVVKQHGINNELQDIGSNLQNKAEFKKETSSQSTELRTRLDALTNRLEAKKTQADRLLCALDARMEKAVSEQGDISKELDLQVAVLMSAEVGLEETRSTLGSEVGIEFDEKFEVLKHRQEEGTEAARNERDGQIREAMSTIDELQVNIDADNRIIVKPELNLDTSGMDETMRGAVILASMSESFTKLAAVAPQMHEALGAYQTAVTEINGAFSEGANRINQQMDQLYEAIDTKVNEVKAGVTELRERAEQAQQLVVEMEEAGENKESTTWQTITSAIGRWVRKLSSGFRLSK